jgi:hypothetical protein
VGEDADLRKSFGQAFRYGEAPVRRGIVDDLWLRTFVIAGFVSLCTAASAITYRFIERPFLLRKARIDSRDPWI